MSAVEPGYTKVPTSGEGKQNETDENPNENRNRLQVNPENSKVTPEPDTEFAKFWKKFKLFLEGIIESNPWSIMMAIITFWTLYQTDIKYATTDRDADEPFEVLISIFFFLFLFEIGAQCIYNDDYFIIPKWEAEPGDSLLQTWTRRLSFGSFYFWMDFVATVTLILDMKWIIGTAGIVGINGGGSQSAKGGTAARTGTRLGRLVRLVRMVRLTRLAKLYKYAYAAFLGKHADMEESSESRVGAAMSDLTNRRVLILVLLMLLIIPLLNVSDPDVSLALGVQLVHSLADLNATNPATYQNGLLLALETVIAELPAIEITLNDQYTYYRDDSAFDRLRPEERVKYYLSSNLTSTSIIYDQKNNTVIAAQYSMYTTTFIVVLLIGGIYAFSVDVQTLVITPIEKLVSLVKKIADNPLGVEYKMLGEEDGFKDGMETTVLLTTINKIGGLMRVGFGEAGAAIIAKNLSESTGNKGKLNLLGKGTMIYSIFGFCDVRQFTDTTECLQEEVMLFVNRIAHILHSIVVQCSGAANKNIGDAFLLTWKIDEKATKEQKALLADQALLTFCKALIELARHQEFICNFSVAATGRLFKRFPDYKVRIGSGLHVGWAIEGAIGSNRKIDASYISPHVSTTEFLESSTKEYGVSLLMSEPFYRLLSPAAARFVRQVDRIRRSEEEGPMGLYTYDSDLSIDWNDPYRHRKMSKQEQPPPDARSRFQNAVRRVSSIAGNNAPQLTAISEHSDNASATSTSVNAAGHRRKSKDSLSSQARSKDTNRRGSVLGKFQPVPLEEVNEEDLEAAETAQQDRIEQAKRAPTIEVPPYTQNIWVTDQDLIDLRHLVNDNFRSIWAEGMDAFIIGDWEKARAKFSETYRLSRQKDGPSKKILEFMKEHHDTCPEDWKGFCDQSGGGGH